MSDSDATKPDVQERQQSALDAIDAAYEDYYDSASDEQLEEERAWAEMVGPNVVVGVDWEGDEWLRQFVGSIPNQA